MDEYIFNYQSMHIEHTFYWIRYQGFLRNISKGFFFWKYYLLSTTYLTNIKKGYYYSKIHQPNGFIPFRYQHNRKNTSLRSRRGTPVRGWHRSNLYGHIRLWKGFKSLASLCMYHRHLVYCLLVVLMLAGLKYAAFTPNCNESIFTKTYLVKLLVRFRAIYDEYAGNRRVILQTPWTS